MKTTEHSRTLAGATGSASEVEYLRAALAAATKQVSTIEDFLWGRKYCTELYVSPLGFNGGEAWQVELNYGDATESFQGESVAEALGMAMVAAMRRRPKTSMSHADKKPTRAKRAAPRSPALRSGDMVGGASPAAEIKPYDFRFTLQYTIWHGGTDICCTDNSTRAELCQLAITQFMASPSGRAWMKRQRTPNNEGSREAR